MNEVVVQDDRYPEWMKAWNAKTVEIDQQIIDYFSSTAQQTSEAMDEIAYRIQAWWDRQHLDPAAKAEYERARAEHDAIKARVEERVEYLTREGHLKRTKTMSNGNGV